MNNKTLHPLDGLKLGLTIALLAGLTGCVGYVDGGGGGAVIVAPEPDVYLFGGGHFDRGRDVHVFSHRGAESRAVAHGGGGRGGRR